MREHARGHLEQERALAAASETLSSPRVAAAEWLDPDAVRARSAELQAQRRAERRHERNHRGGRRGR